MQESNAYAWVGQAQIAQAVERVWRHAVDRPHFVIVKRQSKAPHGRWRRRGQRFDTIIDAVADGYGLGIIPCSVGLAVVDIDKGNPESVTSVASPAFALPTPRGHHLFYRVENKTPAHRNHISLPGGVVCDVICAQGYVVVRDLPAFAAGVENGRGDGFPHALFDSSPAVEKYNAARVYKRTPINLDGAPIGVRNTLLFRTLMHIAGREHARGQLTLGALHHHAELHNHRFGEPLPAPEVEYMARHIYRYLLERPARPKTPGGKSYYTHDVDAQRRRQQASAQAMRDKAMPLVKRTAELAAAGMSTRQIARELGKSRDTIRRWLQVETLG